MFLRPRPRAQVFLLTAQSGAAFRRCCLRRRPSCCRVPPGSWAFRASLPQAQHSEPCSPRQMADTSLASCRHLPGPLAAAASSKAGCAPFFPSRLAALQGLRPIFFCAAGATHKKKWVPPLHSTAPPSGVARLLAFVSPRRRVCSSRRRAKKGLAPGPRAWSPPHLHKGAPWRNLFSGFFGVFSYRCSRSFLRRQPRLAVFFLKTPKNPY